MPLCRTDSKVIAASSSLQAPYKHVEEPRRHEPFIYDKAGSEHIRAGELPYQFSTATELSTFPANSTNSLSIHIVFGKSNTDYIKL